MTAPQFQEVWIEAPDGQSLCALINGEVGWLMYLRENGDAGFSSRNPEYDGSDEAKIEYRLDNGQCDEYPESWAYPLEVVERALQFFRDRHSPPSFIKWNNDSDDGTVLEYEDA